MDLVNILRFVLSLVVVIGLIAGLAWLLRRYGGGRVTMAGGRGRLAVVEAAHIDAKRRLVLVRRDEVEHLVMLSPTAETVIEAGIRPPGSGTFAQHLEAGSGGGRGAGGCAS